MSDDIVDYTLEEALTPPVPCITTPSALKEASGQDVHPDVFNFLPFGTRLLVLREEALKRTASGLYIPSMAQDPPAAGWVISCGQLVGTGRAGHWSSPYTNTALLCRKVLFGKYAGSAFQAGESGESDYESRYVILNEDAIWGIVL